MTRQICSWEIYGYTIMSITPRQVWTCSPLPKYYQNLLFSIVWTHLCSFIVYTELFVRAIHDRDGKALISRVGREVTIPIDLKSQRLVLEELKKLVASDFSIGQTVHCSGPGRGSWLTTFVVFNCCNGLGIVIRVSLKTKRELSRNTAWEWPLTLAAKCLAYLSGFHRFSAWGRPCIDSGRII
jgi:hypothetical protein